MAKLWPVICRHISEDNREDIRHSVNAEIIGTYGKEDQDGDYTVLRLMQKALYDIGADRFLFHIMIFWYGMSDEQKKDAYGAIEKIAERPREK